MPTRNVVLTDHQQQLIDTLVASGQFQNASEVLRDGLRLVEQREATHHLKLEALRRALDIGWADIATGHYVDIDDDRLDNFIEGLGQHPIEPTARG